MSIKSSVAYLLANKRKKEIDAKLHEGLAQQDYVRKQLIRQASKTYFGLEHHFKDVDSSTAFSEAIPIRNYEKLKPYIKRILAGEKNVLWDGMPIYFSKTSGTTSGAKYIPITKASLPNHINTARDTLFSYIANKGNSKILNGKMIFLSGSPQLDRSSTIPTGRLSGIVHNHIPKFLLKNRLPSFTVNCIPDWEEKLKAITEESINLDMTLVSGIPPWVQMYFDSLTAQSGKDIKHLFPNLSAFIHGGVNVNPYLPKLKKSINGNIDFIETFPASEGFFAYQDTLAADKGMLLNTNSGIYYEFIAVEELNKHTPKRIPLAEVELNKNYALLISNNAGLWAYDIGDIISFVSLAPYRLVVKGRTQHFISAFGEHVIAEEVESTISTVANKLGAVVREFTVAPHIDEKNSIHSCHEWFIEFEKMPQDITMMAKAMDELLRQKNIYYDDLRKGNIISSLKLYPVPHDTFLTYMRSMGKLGEQNKVIRLSNDTKVVDHPLFKKIKLNY